MDLLITNGLVVDGTGEPAYKADVAVKNGVTVAVGTNLVHPPGVRIVNAAGVYRKNEFQSHIIHVTLHTCTLNLVENAAVFTAIFYYSFTSTIDKGSVFEMVLSHRSDRCDLMGSVGYDVAEPVQRATESCFA